MSSENDKRFPKRVLKRYAEILLRRIHQSGGQHRYVPLREIEDAIGLEPELILELCQTRLLGEVQVSVRGPTDLAESTEVLGLLERLWIERCFWEVYLRIRPAAVRLTEEELLRAGKKRKRRA